MNRMPLRAAVAALALAMAQLPAAANGATRS